MTLEQPGQRVLQEYWGQCAALAHLNLEYNGIEGVEKRRLGASWRGEASGLLRDFLYGTNRHDLYWIASLWVVATQVRAFDLWFEWLPHTYQDTWAKHGGE